MPSTTASEKDLFCSNIKKNNRIFYCYRGFRLSTVKLLIEYTFPGFTNRIESNNSEFRFDIYLCKHHKETDAEINSTEVDRFRKFYGAGFNVIIGKNEKF